MNGGSEGVLHIPQSSSITGTSPSDYLVSYPGHWLGLSYPSAKMLSVYSAVPVDLAINNFILIYVLFRYVILLYKFISQVSNIFLGGQISLYRNSSV